MTVPAKRNPATELRQMLENPNTKKNFEQLLGARTPAYLSSIIQTTVNSKGLAKCDPRSIIRSAAMAATVNLPIIGDMGYAYLVPYKDVATCQFGWKGFVQLAHRSQEYKGMNSLAIPTNVIKSFNPITTKMEFDWSAPGNATQGYLFWQEHKSGFEHTFYWPTAECDAHGKRYSQSYKKGFGVWVENFPAMAKKTVTKQGLRQWGVLCIDVATAILYDQGTVIDSPDDNLLEGEIIYPDNADEAITAESSAAAKAELDAHRAELVPGLGGPPRTCQQLYDELKGTDGGMSALAAVVSDLHAKGHDHHANKLQDLMLPEAEKHPFEK